MKIEIDSAFGFNCLMCRGGGAHRLFKDINVEISRLLGQFRNSNSAQITRMYDVIIKYLRDFFKCFPLIPSIFILLFNSYLITNIKFIETRGKIGVLGFSEYLTT